MRKLSRYFLVLFFAIPFYSGPLSATEISSGIIRLEQIELAWKDSFNALQPAQREVFLIRLKSDIQSAAQQYPDPTNNENTQIIFQLIDSLSWVIKQQDSESVLVPLEGSLTIDGWLKLFLQSSQIQRDLSLIKEQISRFKSASAELTNNVMSLFVSYREQPQQSKQRITLALNIIRLQLEQILSSEHQRRLQKRAENLAINQTQLQKDLQESVHTLRLDPERQQQRVKQNQAISETLIETQKALTQLELARLGSTVDSLSLKLRIDELVLTTKLIKQTVDSMLLQMEMTLEKSIAGETAPFPLPQQLQWRELSPQKSKLNRQFSELFQFVDASDQNISNEQRSQAWLNLQNIRQQLQEVEISGRQIELLNSAYITITDHQKNWWQREYFQISKWISVAWESSISIFRYPLFSVGDAPVTLLDLIWALLVITIASLISRHLRKALTRFGATKNNVSEAALFTIGRIFHYLIIAAAVVISFSSLGIDLSKLALIAGALSVGIGFGLQSIFNNFISGLILLFERPLKVGDLIELESGLRGRIKSINVRSTQITTWDNIDILVPNSEFISGRVTNYTFSDDLRRLHIPFGVAYGSDKEKVRTAVLEAAARLPYTLTGENQKPDVWLVNYGDSSLDFELVVWFKGNIFPRRLNPIAVYLWEIETSLAEHGIEIPFPQRDLHLRSVDDKIIAKLNTTENKNGSANQKLKAEKNGNE